MFNNVFIIAEAGVNHNGDIKLAYELIDEAVKAKVDCVKFQTFKAEKLVSATAKMADYQKENIGKESSQFEMLKKLELTFDDFKALQAYCNEKGILFLSTPFDEESLDFLVDELDIPYLKISSGDLTNYPFLYQMAKKNKPIIISTGMATMPEVKKSVDWLKSHTDNEVYVLHCTTNYPCPFDEVNLTAMLTIRDELQVPVGYSDHTVGDQIPVAAVALGAQIIEKHFTLDKNMDGPDHRASMEPDELRVMVEKIRDIEVALGHGRKVPNASEEKIKDIVRKKIYPAVQLKQGDTITLDNITFKRSADGIPVDAVDQIVGKKVTQDLDVSDAISYEVIV